MLGVLEINILHFLVLKQTYKMNMGHHGLKNTPVNLMFYEIERNGGKLWPFLYLQFLAQGTFLMYTVDNSKPHQM